MPTIEFKGIKIECRTAAEAAEIARYLTDDSRRNPRVQLGGILGVLGAMSDATRNAWTRQDFWQFIESLGDPQKKILSLLVAKRKMTDQELRTALGVESNQQLAGLLSGISKQAAAHNISARSVYLIENELVGGATAKSYSIAIEFLRAAMDQNWPGS